MTKKIKPKDVQLDALQFTGVNVAECVALISGCAKEWVVKYNSGGACYLQWWFIPEVEDDIERYYTGSARIDDWIVTNPDGTLTSLSVEEYAENYEEV